MSSITFFSSHHYPHSSPLRNKHRFNNTRNFIDKSYCTSNMIQNLDVTYLLPWHWHVFNQFYNSMRHVFQRSKVNTFVMAVFAGSHVAMITNNFANMF
uniref:Uncharacterized protein n=1 Tax=Meloidogyne incognita TaxID=6306 RepID=A0A914NFQ9_MELIC